MKRTNIFVKISAAVMLFTAAACTTDNLQTDGNFISLNISSKSMETRATQDGVDELNENIINDIYYFFYEKGKTDATPVIKGHLVGLDLKSGTKTEEIPVAANAAGSLFASSNQCQVFLVANPPKSMESTLGGSPTLETLRALTLVTSLKGTQESFTMVFDDIEKQSGPSGNIMTVEADMHRLASKMTFAMNTSKTCTDAGSTWTSDPDKAKITFYKAFKETNLAGDFEALKKADDKYNEKFFDSDAITFTTKTVKDTDTWHNVAKQPVYSYPETWDFTGAAEPYILIELPWTKSGATSPVIYYYKIFLDAKELKMNTWCHLTVNIDKLGSTTPDDPTQLFSNLTYLVLNWNNAFESGDGITTDVEEPRYLMLNKKRYDIYNQESWNIPFTSSHECEIIDIEYKKWDYTLKSGVMSGKQNEYKDEEDPLPGLDITIDGSLITFTHTLNNNINDTSPIDNITFGNYDVAEYEVSFILKHKDKDDGSYAETITVIQYPAIYIKALPNTEGATVRTNDNSINSTAFVNIVSSEVEDYGNDPHEMFKTNVVIGNRNGNMYLITTTTAPDLTVVKNDPTTKYILGDPRSTTAMTPKSGVFDGHQWLGNSSASSHTPTMYYPTEDKERVMNMIAPKIRVASSWGQTTSLTYENAKYRCAAYQEDGYPAGRWRVPTAAELMYVCKLSSDHMIPMLYGQAGETNPSYYWCSTGFVEVYGSYEADYINPMEPASDPIYHSVSDPATRAATYWRSAISNGTRNWYKDVEFNDNTTFSVRCVYDEWYWENTSDTTPYTTKNGRMPSGNYHVRIWGDRER